MNFEFINKITSGHSPDLFRTLTYGYLKGASDEEIAKLIKHHALDQQYSTFILPRLKELKNTTLVDDLAKHFISCYKQSSNYKEQRRFCYYLNCIADNCSNTLQQEIFAFLLTSGKRYLRKYAYKRNLDFLGLFQLAWKLVNENPDEATFLINTIAYHYKDEFILNHFEEIISHAAIEDYQIRKLFMRYPILSDENLLWLKNHSPHSFLYIAAMKNHPISDEDCIQIYNHKIAQEEPTFYSYNSSNIASLLLWCLAKLNKWEVIEKLLSQR